MKKTHDISFKKIGYGLILLTLLIFGFSMAKYKSAYAMSDNARVATFVLTDDLEQTISLNVEELTPGVPYTYVFHVLNYNEEKMLEVNVNYTIIIDNEYKVLPLEYKLYKNNDSINILNGNQTEKQQMLHTNQQTDTYTLEVLLPIEYYEYQDLVDVVNISITAEQID